MTKENLRNKIYVATRCSRRKFGEKKCHSERSLRSEESHL